MMMEHLRLLFRIFGGEEGECLCELDSEERG